MARNKDQKVSDLTTADGESMAVVKRNSHYIAKVVTPTGTIITKQASSPEDAVGKAYTTRWRQRQTS